LDKELCLLRAAESLLSEGYSSILDQGDTVNGNKFAGGPVWCGEYKGLLNRWLNFTNTLRNFHDISSFQTQKRPAAYSNRPSG
jgi:hypothetical protein